MLGPLVAGRLLNADILYQAAALDAAAAELEHVLATAVDGEAKVAALARLTEIACDHGDTARAENYLAAAARYVSDGDSPGANAELAFARARYAFSRRNADGTANGAHILLDDARGAGNDTRRWTLAVRSNTYLAVDRYNRRDPGGAQAACKAAWSAVERCPSVPAYVKTHVLTTRAVVDVHDPDRVHLALHENVEAYELALRNGMVATACDALFNILVFWLECEEPRLDSEAFTLARDILDDATRQSLVAEDPMIAAIAAAFRGRYDEAAKLAERAAPDPDQRSDWSPIFFFPSVVSRRARILLKGSRYAEAERLATVALAAWEQSGLGGEGIALRLRAEALERLGQRRAAVNAVENALDALQPLGAVPHLSATYACAYRLTGKRAYREEAQRLSNALTKKVRSGTAGLTARERQIAWLVADGFADKAIAARLGISNRTVSNHVGSIFTRLGIRARWQLTPDMLDAARFASY